MKKISFVVIAYNEERSIGHCLESIQKQESLPDYEIVVVNDGSKDSTANVVSRYAKNNKNIKLLTLSTNQGRGAARQAGVQAAIGQYIAFVDADIILPPHWLTTCMSYMDRYDTVGGIAVPDGDINYIYIKFNLIPKKAKQSTTVTGNNGLYHREIFNSVVFDRNSRDGEDFVFNNDLKEKKFKLYTISSLVVDHRETKSFVQAMRWLFQIGKGASRLLKQFGKVRLPDLTFFGLLVTLMFSLMLGLIFHSYFLLCLMPLYIVFTSILHMYTKFYFQPSRTLSFVAAVFVNSFLLSAYYMGRIVGYFIKE